MEKKYTMKQFIEMFDKAQVKTIEELNDDFQKSNANKENGQEVMFMLHNMMVTAALRRNIFKKEGK